LPPTAVGGNHHHSPTLLLPVFLFPLLFYLYLAPSADSSENQDRENATAEEDHFVPGAQQPAFNVQAFQQQFGGNLEADAENWDPLVPGIDQQQLNQYYSQNLPSLPPIQRGAQTIRTHRGGKENYHLLRNNQNPHQFASLANLKHSHRLLAAGSAYSSPSQQNRLAMGNKNNAKKKAGRAAHAGGKALRTRNQDGKVASPTDEKAASAAKRAREAEDDELPDDPEVLKQLLKKANKELKKKSAKPITNQNVDVVMKINNDLKLKVTNYTKHTLWLTVKCIQTDKDIEKCARKVWKKLNLHEGDGGTGEVPEAYFPGFVTTYGPIIKATVDDRRNYFQEQLKKAWRTWYDQQDPKSLPTEAELLAVFSRTSKNTKLIEFVWDHVMEKAIGTKHWGPNVRHYNCMYSAMQKDYPDKLLIQPQTDAHIQLTFESNRSKWLKMWKYLEDHPDVPPAQVNWRKLDNCEDFRALYSVQNAGQNDKGGWSVAGVNRFQALTAAFQSKRASLGAKKLEAFENPILVKLKKDNAIEEDDHLKQKALTRKRKRGNADAEPVEKGEQPAALDLGLSDSEDEDRAEDEEEEEDDGDE